MMDTKKKICLFGAGKYGKEALAYYGKDKVAYFCDNNSKLWGTLIDDIEVLSFDDYLKIQDDYKMVVAVINSIAMEQIIALLDSNEVKYSFYIDEKKDNLLSNKDIFTNIYKNNVWGGQGEFYSGDGSHNAEIIVPYIDLLVNLIRNNNINSICDIGCGDFNIMHRVFDILDRDGVNCDYVGIDVVEELIRFNQDKWGSSSRKFLNMDITDKGNELPKSDILIIRQVLQHLSNESILNVIDKFSSYKYVLVSEHIYAGELVKYNLDIPTNHFTRKEKLSGVYLEAAPFNCKNIVHLLAIPSDGGIIRTSLIINAR